MLLFMVYIYIIALPFEELYANFKMLYLHQILKQQKWTIAK